MLISTLKRMGSGLLAAVLICSLSIPNIEAYGASMKDIKGHWAEKYINQIIAAGIVKGYENGTFLPDNAVTRAEFSHMINATLGNTGTASVSFNDTPKSEWYYSDVAKALSAGYVSGYSDGSFKPNNPVSRQEAAVMLSRIVPTYGKTANIKSYKDYTSVESWSIESMQRMIGKGYLGAYDDGKLHPADKLTRAQTAKIISDILNNEAIVKNDPNVSSNGTSLTNKIYSNGVTISRSLGDGNAYIENCIVMGKLNVQGGGENSVNISNSRIVSADVSKASDSVRVYLKGETNIENVNVSNNAILQTSSLQGGNFGPGFKKVNVQRNAKVTFTGNFPEVNLAGSNSEVTITSGTVNSLNVASAANSTDVTVETNATILDSDINAACGFHGNGTIRTMRVNADGVTYAKKPTNVYVHSKVRVSPNEVDTNSDISMNPSNRSTNVSRNTDITLTFKKAMTLYNGKSITSSNIDDFVELREGSSNGSKVSFSASISSSKKVITIDPDSKLDDDEKYYVIIDKNELKDSSDNGNDAFSAYFSTGDDDQDGDITMSPAPRKSNVSRNTDITLTFDRAMTLYNGKTITSSNIDDFVELREDSSRGSKVKFNGSINSSKKVITIDPKSRLDDDKRYYVIIDKNELKDSNNNGNASFSAYFSTGDDDQDGDITMDPSPRKSNVSRNTDITLTFDRAMTLYNGKTITSSNIDDFVELREDSSRGSKVKFNGSINSSKKVITIDPKSRLDDDKRYYVIIDKNELKDSNNKGNDAFSAYFSTGDDDDAYTSFTPGNRDTNVSTSFRPTIRFSERVVTYNGSTIRTSDLSDIIDFRVNNSNGSRVSFNASISSDRYITITPKSNLSENTVYYLAVRNNTVKTYSNHTKIPSSYVTFTTQSTSVPQITRISASALSNNSISLTATGNQNGTIYSVVVPSSQSTPSASYIYSARNASGGYPSGSLNSYVYAYTSKYLGSINNLTSGTSYKVCSILRVGSTNSAVYTTTVTTTATSTTPNASISITNKSDSSISARITANEAGTLYAILVPSNETTPSVAQVTSLKNGNNAAPLSKNYGSVSKNGSISLSANSLDSNTSYTVYAVLVTSSAKSALTNASASTNAPVMQPAELSSLTVNGGKISLKSGTYSYSTTVESKDNISVDATASSGASVSDPSQTISIPSGSNTKTITISAYGDNKKTSTYTVTINYSNTGLSSITVDGRDISSSKSIDVDNEKKSVIVSAVSVDNNATVTVNSRSGTGAAEDAVLLNVGSNSVTISVKSNGSSQSYTVTINRSEASTPSPEPESVSTNE
ncbi:Ig-like domain-containing protein [Sinanaerobacter sp. ZZT-01]|uniref:Ig-like domain-containing protein n=1 Tax=Sinanaerobacter sp. ZZT-01 TaxID=3111540 RepID=UPI002D77BBF3|nr:S-layer homology domain-containing protein [Sinanaerobacter sp. ZZT-01]WRR92104.1 S-layer homology domain-containing protein [Sinanaerobacter sp. ZZT-01]